MKQTFAEFKQRLMTHVANRTFRQKKNFLDRLLVGLLASATGYSEAEDPELLHPESHN